jgi:hypothetical protein
MRWLSLFAYWEGLILLSGFFGIVFWKLMTGEISLDGLLEGDVRDSNNASGYSTYASAGRAQSLTLTLFVALYYLVQVVHHPSEFPKLPGGLLGLLAGSQALYLGGKARALVRGSVRDFLNRRTS